MCINQICSGVFWQKWKTQIQHGTECKKKNVHWLEHFYPIKQNILTFSVMPFQYLLDIFEEKGGWGG